MKSPGTACFDVLGSGSVVDALNLDKAGLRVHSPAATLVAQVATPSEAIVRQSIRSFVGDRWSVSVWGALQVSHGLVGNIQIARQRSALESLSSGRTSNSLDVY